MSSQCGTFSNPFNLVSALVPLKSDPRRRIAVETTVLGVDPTSTSDAEYSFRNYNQARPPS